MQHRGRRIERKICAGFDARIMPALDLTEAHHSHVIGENPTEAQVRELCRALLLRRRISLRPDFEFQAHCPVSRCRRRRYSPPDRFVDSGRQYPSADFTTTSLAAGFPTRLARKDMLL